MFWKSMGKILILMYIINIEKDKKAIGVNSSGAI